MSAIPSGYRPHFSGSRLRDKVRRHGGRAGRQLIERSLQLYYAAQDPATPDWARGVIYSALGYFIAPVDAVPDLAPVAGFSDDLGVLATAVAVVAMHITPAIQERAAAQVERWLGPARAAP